ncbi:hypothetical protein [Fulvivirga lutea]|uniref:histidine kinase n=1 Tax=Fulvivirga lutea TaxID=2810512 RepID=A0A974WEU1_9BACT|nr:hypothetical protein [Fulvivirga lutea]QSE96349.1 hypothetical protein JR347_12095 [Fulvivirga lutea]
MNIESHYSSETKIRQLTLIITWLIFVVGVVVLIFDALQNLSSFPNYISASPILLILVSLVSLLCYHYKYYKASKFLVSFFPISIILLFQFLFGKIINEYFFWFPYAVVAGSLAPSVLFSFKENKWMYMAGIFYYFTILLFIDDLMIKFASDNADVVPIVIENKFFYKLLPIVIYLFINGALLFLKKQNSQFELRLIETNRQLLESKYELELTLESVENQRQLIEIRNNEIKRLNEALLSKIEDVSSELQEKKSVISDYIFQNSHEIRGPVATMLGLIHLLEIKSLDTAEKARIINNIKQTCESLDLQIRTINRRLE